MLFTKCKPVLVMALAAGLLTACKKEVDEQATGTIPVTGTAADKIRDSAVLYTKDLYLWADKIPSTFTGSAYSRLDSLMIGIRQFSLETGYVAPVDKWNFAMKQAEWDNVSSGVAGDFGMNVFFNAEGDLRVKSVEAAAPAGLAGVHRGWRIVKIAGSANITTGNADFIVTNVWGSASTAFTFQKPDGSTVDLTLKAATYQENPILLDSVYTTAAGKTGYLVFNSFLGDTTQIYNAFGRVFSRFASAGVNSVIVDLRYNGGGYVDLQQKLANYLINSSANGKLMMKQQYNSKYAQYNSADYFKKLGSLNVDKVYFIVSNSTASASELLINNLKPYMTVKLIGPSATYGKPVGFFPVPVGDWYIFPVSFRSTNGNNEGAYFNGLPTNATAKDGLDKNWGDVAESCLTTAIGAIEGRITVSAVAEPQSQSAEVKLINSRLDQNNFKGAIAPERTWR